MVSYIPLGPEWDLEGRGANNSDEKLVQCEVSSNLCLTNKTDTNENTRLPPGSVSSRECLDAPAILATFTAGRTGLAVV